MQFTASITYYETTPESVEVGDFSDSGFIEKERKFDDLRELIDYMEMNGYMYASEYPTITSDDCWFYTNSFVTDYGTVTEREENIQSNTSVVRRASWSGE